MEPELEIDERVCEEPQQEWFNYFDDQSQETFLNDNYCLISHLWEPSDSAVKKKFHLLYTAFLKTADLYKQDHFKTFSNPSKTRVTFYPNPLLQGGSVIRTMHNELDPKVGQMMS